jgi:hypothetical protein
MSDIFFHELGMPAPDRPRRRADPGGCILFAPRRRRAYGALLLHGGTGTFPLTRRVLAVPWWQVC